MKKVVVSGSFDDLRSRQMRFLEEASKIGELHVLLWSDAGVFLLEGKYPKFPQEERLYLLQAVRYVSDVTLVEGQVEHNSIPLFDEILPDAWVVDEENDNHRKKAYCEALGVEYRLIKNEVLAIYPANPLALEKEGMAQKRVIVTGCFDWFHSGHVRFFEEVAELGDLYVIVGHDANVRLLKGEGHPMFPQDVRRYMAQSIRTVKEALISSGHGWMDAEPEIALLKPDIYAVNEEGDKPEKRAFCEEHGLEYVVLRRLPKAGLPKRESTSLRGF